MALPKSLCNREMDKFVEDGSGDVAVRTLPEVTITTSNVFVSAGPNELDFIKPFETAIAALTYDKIVRSEETNDLVISFVNGAVGVKDLVIEGLVLGADSWTNSYLRDPVNLLALEAGTTDLYLDENGTDAFILG